MEKKPEEKKPEDQPTTEEMLATLKRAEEKRLAALESFYKNTARIYGERARR